ncbi:MAG TPA: biotin/lipoyl-binding protein [Pyrinomonadaceae bacterium]|nr:biotin/lipoyl-binding protein [Pyrinomonadaceae bacterium]
MKLHAELDGTKHEVDIKRDGGKVNAAVDGREYSLDVSQPEPGLYVLRDGAAKHVAHVTTKPEVSLVSINGRAVEVALSDPKRLRGSGSDHEHGDGLAEIKTAMPGKVVRILVAEGDTVAKGDGVIVVEAMKMQNEMKSPKDGTVAAIKVAEGDTVEAGALLLTIE